MAAQDWPNLYRVTATLKSRAHGAETRVFTLLAVDYEDAFKAFYGDVPFRLREWNALLSDLAAIQIERISGEFAFTDGAYEKFKALK